MDTYRIEFRLWFTNPNYVDVCKGERFPSLQEAKKHRSVSGDLVVNASTGKIVTDDEWLWDWEKADSTAHAHKAILWQKAQK